MLIINLRSFKRLSRVTQFVNMVTVAETVLRINGTIRKRLDHFWYCLWKNLFAYFFPKFLLLTVFTQN